MNKSKIKYLYPKKHNKKKTTKKTLNDPTVK